MNISDLRIGSLILQNGSECRIYQIEHRYKTIYRINDLDIDERYVDDRLKPIKTTHQRLIQYGFECPKTGKYEHGEFPFVLYWNVRKGVYYGEQIDGHNVNEWHILQNLFKVLTNAELIISK